MKNSPSKLVTLSEEQQALLKTLLEEQGAAVHDEIVPRPDSAAPALLSSTQQRLCLLGRSAGDLAFGNVPMAFRIAGPLRVDWIEQGLNEIVRRHEILRTTFPQEADQSVQMITPTLRLAVPVVDLRDLPAERREAEALARVASEAGRPFEVANEPLVRCSALRTDESTWVLFLNLHHLVTDGLGARLMLRELAALYRAAADGTAAQLPVLSIQYADYSVWERRRLDSGGLREQIAFWTRELRGAATRLSLPIDRPYGAQVTLRSSATRFKLDADLSRQLRQVAAAQGVTLYTLLLSSFMALLQRGTGEKEVVVGTTVSNRNRIETENLIGNFGNNLLMRVSFAGNPVFREVLERTGRAVADAHAHAELPLESLVTAIQDSGEGTPLPRFHVMFILRDSAIAQNLDLPRLTVETIPVGANASALDLILDVSDNGPAGITGHFEYRSDLFEPDTIEHMERDYRETLARISADPALRLDELPKPRGGRSSAQQHIAPPVPPSDQAEAPRTDMETLLADLWQKSLGLSEVNIHDNFYDLGGHSLLVLDLIVRIERRTGVKLDPIEFGTQTLGQLAAHCAVRLQGGGAASRKGLMRKLFGAVRKR